MKKKILLISLMVVLFACLFAISVSARTDYREEQTYNYYDESGNLLYSATTIYAYDSLNSGKYRFEVIIRESGDGFAKFDENGTPLTWYVTSTDKLDDKIGGDSLEQDGVIDIVVTSVPTLDSSIASVDANGVYTYKCDEDGIYFSKKVVSANFFTTGVKSFTDKDNGAHMFKVVEAAVKPNGNTSEYCKLTDNGNLLCLYLPKTLTSLPKDFCKRSSLRVLEFEDNQIAGTALHPTAFTFCANLKKLVIPNGPTKIEKETFRECISLSYVKMSDTVLRVEENAFSRCSSIETFIMGNNMTYCGQLNTQTGRFHVEENKADCVKIKYYYVSPSLNTANCKFDNYRGNGNDLIGDLKNVIFFFPGDLAQAQNVANYATESFKATLYKDIAEGKSMNYNAAIDYATYIANKEYYDTQITHHLLVYNAPSDLSDCVVSNGTHKEVEINTYKDAITSFVVGTVCENCGISFEVEEYAPLLTYKGYSAQIDGNRVTVGYTVDKTTQAFLSNLSYGVLIAVPGENEDANAYEPVNPDFTVNAEKALVREVNKKYDSFNLIVDGFEESNYDKEAVLCAFVSDGEKIDYICYNENNEIAQQGYAKSATFAFIADQCIPRYNLTFSSNNEDYGTVEGNLSQTVKEGETTTTVTAVAKDGYEFACWSDGTQTAEITVTPEKSENLVAYFTPKSTGLPVMTINTTANTPITTKDYYIGCEITLLDNTDNGSKSIGGQEAEIKGRGNSTWDRFDKKPYKFKFEDKQNLFGYGKEKTWVLLADARDYSLIRNMLAYNAGLSMSELGFTSKGQSVELYLNGEYRGVYYLCEQIQVKENRVNITQEDKDLVQAPADLGYLIEMDAWAADGSNKNLPNYTKDGDVFVEISGGQKPFVIKDPEDVFFDDDGNFSAENAAPYLEYIQGYLQDCHNAIYAAKTEENYAKVCELIDVKSFAQAYIIFDLFKNPDVNYSSVYYYKDANGKLVCAPLWDFDMSVGNVTHKEGGKGWEIFSDTTRLWTKERNYWFNQLLQYEEFHALVYAELVANKDAIMGSIANDLAYARAHADAYEKNFEKWNLIGNTSATEAMGAWSIPDEFKAFENWEDHLDYIENYLNESYAYLLTYYAPAAE